MLYNFLLKVRLLANAYVQQSSKKAAFLVSLISSPDYSWIKLHQQCKVLGIEKVNNELPQRYYFWYQTVCETCPFLKVSYAVIRSAVNDKPKRDPLFASPSYAALLEKMALLITWRHAQTGSPVLKDPLLRAFFCVHCPFSPASHLKLPDSQLHWLAKKHGGSLKPAVMHTAISGSTFSSQKG